MNDEWGALHQPSDGSGCNLAENPVTWEIEKNISHHRAWWGGAQYKHGVLVRAFMQDCSGTQKQIYPPKGAQISLGRRD